MRLKYKSLVTRENIENILSRIEGRQQVKSNLINLLFKIDIRISTEPVIAGNEFYYKIWILRKGTYNRAHIKDYYSLELLKEKSQSPISLAEILEMVRINADVSDDFEEYCEMRFQDPSDASGRIDYLDDLKRAKRFKKFLSLDDVRSMSFSFVTDNFNNNSEKDIDMDNESDLKLLGYSIISLNDKKEYDKLVDLHNTLEYYAKITESYGFDRYTNEFNEKLFPVTKHDQEMKNIKIDIDNYNKALHEYNDYLKHLIKKYKIKLTGNTLKRVAFFLAKDVEWMNNKNCKVITAVLDYKFFS